MKEYNKICPWCKKSFSTTARNQKFCCPECGKKYNKKRALRKDAYNKQKGLHRLYARSHSLAVETINQLVLLNKRSYKCELCGSVECLEVHHKNLVWLDNTPQNLSLLCKRCHALQHSSLERQLDDMGLLVEEYINPSFKSISDALNSSKV